MSPSPQCTRVYVPLCFLCIVCTMSVNWTRGPTLTGFCVTKYNCRENAVLSGTSSLRPLALSRYPELWLSLQGDINFSSTRLKKKTSSLSFILLLLFAFSFFSYPPKIGIWNFHAVCVSGCPPYRLLNALTNLYETWYVYHNTWAHFSGVLPKSLPSICVTVWISLLSLLGNGSVNTFPPQRIQATIGQFLGSPHNSDSKTVGRTCPPPSRGRLFD
jgi:hypothetical protein